MFKEDGTFRKSFKYAHYLHGIQKFHANRPISQTVFMLSIAINRAEHVCATVIIKHNRPISQTVFMLSIAINRAEHVCAAVIIKHNYMLMCNHKIIINIMLCLINSTGHI